MSFRFSLLDPDFNIFVDREIVSNKDLKDLMSATEFLWIINGYSDDYVKGLGQLKADVTPITTPLELSGFFGTVTKPRDLKISRTDERATVDLFVNGRLREKNIIRHIPTQRIVESYLYGQVHFDFMDSTGNDPFTSSREGIVEGDPNFLALMKFLKGEVIPKVLEDWDVLRLARGKEGDDENARVSKRKRKALDLYTAATEEYRPEESGEARDQVDLWMDELRPDAQFNVDAYVDCFLSENLVRKYLKHHSIISDEAKKRAHDYAITEQHRKAAANISFDIRKDNDPLSYLGMDQLAVNAEGGKPQGQTQSLWNDAISFRPVRNAVGHTGLLTQNAKSHLSLTFQNIRARIKSMMSKPES